MEFHDLVSRIISFKNLISWNIEDLLDELEFSNIWGQDGSKSLELLEEVGVLAEIVDSISIEDH